MRRIALHIIALFIRIAALLLRVFPVKARVAFLSRQSADLSLDYSLLIEKLKDDDSSLNIEVCIAPPETKGKAAFVVNTLKQLRLAQTSSVVIVDGYLPAVSVPVKRRGITVIQLWHAVGAIKQFGYQCLDTLDGRDGDSARILKMHRNYDYVIAGGSWAVGPLSLAFDVDSNAVLPIGLPRTDYLRGKAFSEKRNRKKKEILADYPILQDGKRNILYAPTFRRRDMAFCEKLLVQAAKAAKNLPVNFIYSGHPLGEENVATLDLPGNCIVGTSYRTIDLLSIADVLITDYSAVAYEGAASGVPVLFFVPDIDEYGSSPGLNVNPAESCPDCTAVDELELQALLGETIAYSQFNECVKMPEIESLVSLSDLIRKSL